MELNEQIIHLIDKGYSVTFSPGPDRGEGNNPTRSEMFISIRKQDVIGDYTYIRDQRGLPAFPGQEISHLQFLIDSLKETK